MFWAYLLHCNGGRFYVGHTDDLERRLAEHEHGALPGFTADHRPVTLVWSQDFPTRIEALEAERRLKGWSRAKKMALIRGDWALIAALAKKKGGPSTSSGQTAEVVEDSSLASNRIEIVGASSPLPVRAEPVEARPPSEDTVT